MEDIAAALSRLCRFGGHCRVFYSIAQHSVHVAELVQSRDPEATLWALLHDAAEAYLHDLPRPIKYARGMEFYREAEARLDAVLMASFGLAPSAPDVVRWADHTLFATEVRDLMTNCRAEFWTLAEPPRPERIDPWDPERAEAAFLSMFRHLTSQAAGE